MKAYNDSGDNSDSERTSNSSSSSSSDNSSSDSSSSDSSSSDSSSDGSSSDDSSSDETVATTATRPDVSDDKTEQMMVDQRQFSQMVLSDVPNPDVSYKEIGVHLRYVGGQVLLDDDDDIASYTRNGGCITLTAGAVKPTNVLRSRGKGVSPNCDLMLASGQQFIVKGEMFAVLGLLWVGFGKLFKGRKGNKTKKPAAPLLVLTVPISYQDIPADDYMRYIPHLTLFVAHHVLSSASFPVDTIRRNDIKKLSSVFISICREHKLDKAFWKRVQRM